MELMYKNRIRQLPVVEGRKVVGIITDRDLREASASSATSLSVWELNYLLEQVKVKDMMTHDVITVSPETSVEEAARIINDNKIGGLPVVEKDVLVGIITESDLLDLFIAVMGINGASTRIDVVMGDDPKAFETVSKIVQESGGAIFSVGITEAKEAEKTYFFRLEPCDPIPIKTALQKAGYEVRSIAQTPSRAAAKG
jgi:acetoin utilization protein AcuB